MHRVSDGSEGVEGGGRRETHFGRADLAKGEKKTSGQSKKKKREGDKVPSGEKMVVLPVDP